MVDPIKRLLKRIFPTPFLKKCFLIYNKIRILTIDKILFPEFRISKDQFFIYRKGFPFKEEDIIIDDLQEGKVKAYMKSWYDWEQDEFILFFDQKCWIEPKHGWAIVEPNKLVYFSLGVSRTWFQKKPEFFKFLIRKNSIQIKKAISLRDTGEENYFHFYNDVLSKLFFLREHGVNVCDYPVIVSERLWNKEYFQHYLQRSEFLQSLKWILQNDRYIQCESVIFCKALTHKKKLWRDIITPIMENVSTLKHRRIFLTRSRSRLRFIENMDEIEKVCRKHSFEIFDSDTLPFVEQISLFSQVKYLVGIHGAGLTNMVFRKGYCSVLELFPPPDLGYLPYHYIMLAKINDFQYNALVGEQGRVKYSGGFYLEKDKFEKMLLHLLAVTN
jgi:hypothetical protein